MKQPEGGLRERERLFAGCRLAALSALGAGAGLRDVTWRAPAPRWRRSVPAGFIRPCEPALVAYPPAGHGWLHEIKHDGFRILAWKQGERVKVWSRRGADFTYRFRTIADPAG